MKDVSYRKQTKVDGISSVALSLLGVGSLVVLVLFLASILNTEVRM